MEYDFFRSLQSKQRKTKNKGYINHIIWYKIKKESLNCTCICKLFEESMLKSNEKQINDSLEWKLYLFDKLVKGEHKIHSSMYNGQTKKLLNCLNKKKKN